jgi:hypothetical protein
LVLLLMPTSQTGADGRWLDGDLVSWNAAGMVIPAAPGKSFVLPELTYEVATGASRAYPLLWRPGGTGQSAAGVGGRMTRGVGVGGAEMGAPDESAVGIAVAAGVVVGGGSGAVATGEAVGIAASIGGAAVGGTGVEVGRGTGTSVGNGVAVGMGAMVGGISAGTIGVAVGNSATWTGAVAAAGAIRAVAMASTSARGSLPLSGATPVTA